MQPIGIRNNNPLNIRVGKSKWKGQINGNGNVNGNNSSPSPTAKSPSPRRGDRGEAGEAAFCVFESMEYGIRAAFCILRTYATKYRLCSIRDIITRWAPPSENDTQSYIRHVCMMTGFGGNQRLTEKDWPRLVKAMAKIECGADLDDEVIERARRSLTPTASPTASPLTPLRGEGDWGVKGKL